MKSKGYLNSNFYLPIHQPFRLWGILVTFVAVFPVEVPGVTATRLINIKLSLQLILGPLVVSFTRGLYCTEISTLHLNSFLMYYM